jgi:hypothetical protein
MVVIRQGHLVVGTQLEVEERGGGARGRERGLIRHV